MLYSAALRPCDVVDDEGLVREPPQKVGEDEFEYVVVGRKGGVKYPVFPLHKAQKAGKIVRFARHFFDGVARFEYGGVGEHVAHGRLSFDEQADILQSRHLPLRAAAAQNQRNFADGSAVDRAQLFLHTRTLFRIRHDLDERRSERDLKIPGGGHDAAFIRAGGKHGGIKARGRAVGEIYVHS